MRKNQREINNKKRGEAAARGKMERERTFLTIPSLSKCLWKKSYDFAKMIYPDHKLVTLREHKVQINGMLVMFLYSFGIFFALKAYMGAEKATINTVFIAIGLTILIELMLVYYEIKKIRYEKR